MNESCWGTFRVLKCFLGFELDELGTDVTECCSTWRVGGKVCVIRSLVDAMSLLLHSARFLHEGMA